MESPLPPDASPRLDPLRSSADRHRLLYKPGHWDISETLDLSPLDWSDGSPAGVWVVAPDESAAINAVVINANGYVPAGDAAWWHLQEIVGTSGISTIHDVESEANGISGAFVGVEVNGMVAAVHAIAIPNPLTGSSFLAFNLEIAAAVLFGAATEQVFLPILGQFPRGGGDTDDDSDGDGDDDGDDV